MKQNKRVLPSLHHKEEDASLIPQLLSTTNIKCCQLRFLRVRNVVSMYVCVCTHSKQNDQKFLSFLVRSICILRWYGSTCVNIVTHLCYKFINLNLITKRSAKRRRQINAFLLSKERFLRNCVGSNVGFLRMFRNDFRTLI